MTRKFLLYRLQTISIISFTWILFGIVFFENLIRGYNDLGVRVSLANFVVFFGAIGFLVSATMVFYIKPAFPQWPDWLANLSKSILTVLLLILIAFILLLIYYLLTYNGGFDQYVHSFFTKIVYTRTFFVFVLDMVLMTLLSIILLEVTDKYGPGMFWGMLVGQYHKPRIENRIFIFLDINESTTIAEKLGHEDYFLLLRRFFRDITLPVLSNDGEIYQYVGDEIVLSWPNTPANKLKSLKFIRQAFFLVERQKKRYLRRYGRVPYFKAGVHAGEVTAGYIGVIKRELIYSGDTVNTTARIRSLCHELNSSYLLSDDFLQDFHQPHGYSIAPVGEMDLKGRQQAVKLHSLSFD